MVGSALVRELAADPAVQRIDLLLRRSLNLAGGKIQEFCADSLAAAIQAWVAAGGSCEAFVCALGTTRRAASSLEAFVAVDRDLVVQLAAEARRAGVGQAIVVSSVGADARSRNAYLRTKGEMQESIAALGFARCDFLQPGLLRGRRCAAASRPAERIGQLLSPLADALLHGRLRKYRSIPAITVARAATRLLGASEAGVYCQRFDRLTALAGDPSR